MKTATNAGSTESPGLRRQSGQKYLYESASGVTVTTGQKVTVALVREAVRGPPPKRVKAWLLTADLR